MYQKRVRKSRRQTKTAHNSRMGEDFVEYLPLEITLDILLRLPNPTIGRCKCVCKAWLNLLKTPEFVKSRLSQSVPSLAVFSRGVRGECEVYEFVDELIPKEWASHSNIIFKFCLPYKELYSSVNGLFFLRSESWGCYVPRHRDLFISNPITREYIKLPFPPVSSSSERQVEKDTFGFGLSRITGQYKLVRIFQKRIIGETTVSVECQVYTVGTGSWRRIFSVGRFKYDDNAKGVFLNGNLHWMVTHCKGSCVWISCFDLETERFCTFSPPPCVDDLKEDLVMCSLKDCLCLCDNSPPNEIVIWLMKEYGVEKSWAKEFVIWKEYVGCCPREGPICPIKVFESGDILMVSITDGMLLYSSKKTESICPGYLCEDPFCIGAVTYTPSFLPLRSFASENVTTF